MGRKVCAVLVGLGLFVAASGCASKGALNELDQRVVALDAKVKSDIAEMTKAQAAAAEQRKALDARIAALESSVQQIKDLAARAEASAADASRQIPALKSELERFNAQFKQMDASIAQAQQLIIKNLENARDIYKTQFLALEEVLQKMEKPAAPEAPK